MNKEIPVDKLEKYLIKVDRTYFQKDNITVYRLTTWVPMSKVLGGITIKDFSKELKQRFPQIKTKFSHSVNNISMQIIVYGKAYCSQNDSFNEKRGRDIAYAKANRKLYDIMRRINDIAIQMIKMSLTHSEGLNTKLRNAYLREDKFIQRF